jgi:uncharacterized membrane protein YfcA
MPVEYLWLLPLGFFIGAFGTLIGAGGGFILVPILLLLYPDENTELITGISLAVVFFNATSGSVAYARMKRVDYKSGVIFALATVPGAILGALCTAYISRRVFDFVFGVFMVLISVYLWRSSSPQYALNSRQDIHKGSKRSPSHLSVRTFTDSTGVQHDYAYNSMVGIGLSLMVGFASSLLGVGGGFIHMPVLVKLLNFPVHVATATSQFVLAISALTGTAVHVAQGVFANGVRRTAILAIGVVIGAQGGAWLSTRVGGTMIIRGLAVGLACVGLRLIAF